MTTVLATADEKFNTYPPVVQTPDESIGTVVDRLSASAENPELFPKKFDAAWIGKLSQRGYPKLYDKFNSHRFDFIGMPIGGIGAGELYLGGDGRLWDWGIFNRRQVPIEGEEGAAYANPHVIRDPNDDSQYALDQGFVLRTVSGGKTDTRVLDRDGFASVQFNGQYPIGSVDYADTGCPVRVNLEAFSPFIPGDVADSSYPATILNYTITNRSTGKVDGTLAGWLENGVGIETKTQSAVTLHNAIAQENNATVLNFSAGPDSNPTATGTRPPIVFDDFESGTFDNWTVDGTAFGKAPTRRDPPAKGLHGHFYADSYAAKDDKLTGKLTSKPFTIDLNFITFLIGGGSKPGRECVNLLVDGQVVATAHGASRETVKLVAWDVRPWIGKSAQLVVVDDDKEGWGHIMVDDITFCDVPVPASSPGMVEYQPDIGTLALTLLGDPKLAEGVAQLGAKASSDQALDAAPSASADIAGYDPALKCAGALRRHFTLGPDEKMTVTFIVSWYFPNPMNLGLKTSNQRGYTSRFKSAQDVADHLAQDLDRLTQATRLWRDTWYDSTLPYWFLDRTFLNSSTLATDTSFLLDDGRFYGYEGRFTGPGTCTHVWGYQQAMGYLFPDLEKAILDKAEFVPGLGMDPVTGGVNMRGEFEKNPPADGQACVILRAYLANRMSPDDAFLQSHYASIKKATNFLMNNWDADRNGILDGRQVNTMDAAWYGQIPWLSLDYQAALRATAEMADAMNDSAYAQEIRGVADLGRGLIEKKLFDGEYFFAQADGITKESPGIFKGCQLDQLMGQNWAYEVGLGSIVDPAEALTALNSIWRYNYSTDLGPYRAANLPGRNFASAGEGGLLVASFPKGSDKSLESRTDTDYYNECWTGSEYTAASLMMWAGLTDKALAEVRTIHDRYDATKRNPWNEVEYGSHYSRAMASYGVFTAAEGFEYDGPHDYIAFAPRMTPENFRAPFTAAEGWGTYSQKADATSLSASIEMRYGKLRLKTLALELPVGDVAARTVVKVAGNPVQVQATADSGRLLIVFDGKAIINTGQSLTVESK